MCSYWYGFNIINSIWILVFFIALIYPAFQSISVRYLMYKKLSTKIYTFSGKCYQRLYPYSFCKCNSTWIQCLLTVRFLNNLTWRRFLTWKPNYFLHFYSSTFTVAIAKKGNKLNFSFDFGQKCSKYCFEFQDFEFETKFVR